MPFLSGGHLWVVMIVLAIVLIVKGPGKLPEVGSGLGRALREFKNSTNEVRDAVKIDLHGDHASQPETAVVASVPVAAVPVAPATVAATERTPVAAVAAEG